MASITTKYPNRINVGFAAETNIIDDEIMAKLKKKKCDILIANEVGGGKGFNSNYNKATIYTKNEKTGIGFDSKINIAKKIISFISKYYSC